MVSTLSRVMSVPRTSHQLPWVTLQGMNGIGEKGADLSTQGMHDTLLSPSANFGM